METAKSSSKGMENIKYYYMKITQQLPIESNDNLVLYFNLKTHILPKQNRKFYQHSILNHYN